MTLPAIISLAAVMWLFKTVSNLTDLLLFFLPKTVTHTDNGNGEVLWYWSLIALALAVALLTVIGVVTRHYIGKRIIGWLDTAMLNVPLFNKFYGAIKQVNDAFSGSKNSFKTVVLVEFPREGMYSIGFITGEQHDEVQLKTNEKVVAVFIPTTPNPTSGFMVLVPEHKVTRLDMSVPDGVKYIVSLGTIPPETAASLKQKSPSSPP